MGQSAISCQMVNRIGLEVAYVRLQRVFRHRHRRTGSKAGWTLHRQHVLNRDGYLAQVLCVLIIRVGHGVLDGESGVQVGWEDIPFLSAAFIAWRSCWATYPALDGDTIAKTKLVCLHVLICIQASHIYRFSHHTAHT